MARDDPKHEHHVSDGPREAGTGGEGARNRLATRRAFLASVGVAGAGAGLGVAADRILRDDQAGSVRASEVSFFGDHQAGIATPSQEHIQFATFDLIGASRADLRALLEKWSAAGAALARCVPVGPFDAGSAGPEDTAEAVGLPAAGLTVTFGLGPSLFGREGRDVLGLKRSLPGPLAELPAFAGDALEPNLCGGDLAVQVCADEPQVAFHGLHDLIRIAAPFAAPRWSLMGFGRTSNSRDQETPRNLMGFKDGTDNLRVEDHRALDEFVWAGPRESPGWMSGGSYMVVRRIRMRLGAWDAVALADQERTFGRRKISGAPLGSHGEFDVPDFQARAAGRPVIPADAHIRLASPGGNGGQRILRRGYNFVEGLDHATGSVGAGLFFVCYQRDPRKQFVAIQQRLSSSDALNQHIEHIGSAVFACPPGARRGGFVGEGLLAS